MVWRTKFKSAVYAWRLLLCEDDGDGVVEDALAEHQHVEDGVHVQGVEDGNGCYGIHGRDQRAEGEATAGERE